MNEQPSASELNPLGGPLTPRDWLLGGLMTLALMTLAVLNADYRGFWIDELYTLRAILFPAEKMLEDRFTAGHLPPYFFFARLGMLFGMQEWQLKMPTIIVGGLTLLLLTTCLHLARARRLRWPLWLLVLCHPYWIWLITQLRYMMFMLFLSSLALVAWFWWARRPGWRRALPLAVAIILVPLSHGTGLIIAPCFALAMYWHLRGGGGEAGGTRAGRVEALLGAWPGWLPIAAALPAYLMLDAKNLRVDDLGLPPVAGVIENLLEVNFAHQALLPSAFGYTGNGPWDDLILLLQIAVLAGGIYFGRQALRQGRGTAAGDGPARLRRIVWALFLLFPALFLLSACFTTRFAGTARYMVGFTLPCLLLLAAAWGARVETARQRRWHRAWRVGLVGLLALQFPAGLFDRYDRFRETALWMSGISSGEPMLVSVIKPTRVGLEYYSGRQMNMFIHDIGSKDAGDNRVELENCLRSQGRVLYLLYHSQTRLPRAIQRMKKEHLIVGERSWRINSVLRAGALISDERHRAWLEGLPDPPHLPGPARKDFE